MRDCCPDVTGTCIFEFYLWTNIQMKSDSLGLISIPLACIHTHNYLVWRWLTIKQSQPDKYVIWSKRHLNGTHFYRSEGVVCTITILFTVHICRATATTGILTDNLKLMRHKNCKDQAKYEITSYSRIVFYKEHQKLRFLLTLLITVSSGLIKFYNNYERMSCFISQNIRCKS